MKLEKIYIAVINRLFEEGKCDVAMVLQERFYWMTGQLKVKQGSICCVTN